MDQPVLTDKNQFPTNEIIFSHIGKVKAVLWENLFEYFHQAHPDFSEEWRYYNDGKSWLLKITRKKKTVCWISVVKNFFRMTFYFTDKAEPLLVASSISDDLKNEFLNGKKYGRIRGITIAFNNKNDLSAADTLISIKEKLL